MELNERVATLETKAADTDRRLDKLETVTEAIHDLASGVKQMSTDMAEVKQDIKNVESKVNDLEDKPGKASLKAWLWLLGLVGGAVVTGIIGIVATTLF